MSRSPDWKIPAAAVLATAAFAGALLGLVALQSDGEARLGGLTLLRIAAGYDRRAQEILGPTVPPPAQRRYAATLSRSAVGEFPYDISAWLRLAYVDKLEHGGLTRQGVAYLRRSYDLVAVDSELGFWRIRFALENSEALPPDLRASVRNEAMSMSVNPNHLSDLRKIQPTIRNPAGRLSLALWLNRLTPLAAK